MPQLAGIFSHVIVDVSSIKFLCIRWFSKGKLFLSTHANLTWPKLLFPSYACDLYSYCPVYWIRDNSFSAIEKNVNPKYANINAYPI
jgi:hypothetical protein